MAECITWTSSHFLQYVTPTTRELKRYHTPGGSNIYVDLSRLVLFPTKRINKQPNSHRELERTYHTVTIITP